MKEQFEDNKALDPGALFSQVPSEQGQPVITVDYEAYAHFLDASDMSEDAKRALVQSLWNIIVEFVSLGFGVHPLQRVDALPSKPEASSTSAEHVDHARVLEEVDS